MNKFNFLPLLILSVLLTGCATAPKSNTVVLSNSLSYTLTPPPLSHITKTESNLVEITYNEQQHRFIAQVEYNPNEIAMAAVSIEGVPLFDFVWRTNSAIQINQYVPLPNINIQNIIADMQLCHWPIAQITSSLHGININVLQQKSLDDTSIIWQRTIHQENQLIIKIDKSKNGFQLEHILRNYHIKLTHLKQVAHE